MIYRWKTPTGPVELRPAMGQRYEVYFGEESLGSYHSAKAAADDVAGGHTFTPSSGIDLGTLGISRDLGDWEQIPFRGKRH